MRFWKQAGFGTPLNTSTTIHYIVLSAVDIFFGRRKCILRPRSMYAAWSLYSKLWAYRASQIHRYKELYTMRFWKQAGFGTPLKRSTTIHYTVLSAVDTYFGRRKCILRPRSMYAAWSLYSILWAYRASQIHRYKELTQWDFENRRDLEPH